jgi:F0F1-type ATP synthase membrane subunit c/vacuolar-type H+-ATPase subunit K
MANILSLLVVTFALLLSAIGIGLWAAATTTDNARPRQMSSQLELPR